MPEQFDFTPEELAIFASTETPTQPEIQDSGEFTQEELAIFSQTDTEKQEEVFWGEHAEELQKKEDREDSVLTTLAGLPKDYIKTTIREIRSGLSAIEESSPTARAKEFGVKEAAKTAGYATLGTLQTAFAPLTAAAEVLVKEPVTGGLKAIGVKDSTAETIGTVAEIAALIALPLPAGKARASAKFGKMIGKRSKEVDKIYKSAIKNAEGAPPKLKKELIDAAEMDKAFSMQEINTLVQAEKTAPKLKQSITEKFIDVAGPAKSAIAKHGAAGMRAVESFNLIPGAHGRAEILISAVKEPIYKGMDATKTKLFDMYLRAEREITIAAYKPGHVSFVEPSKAKAWLKHSLSPEVQKDFVARKIHYDKAMYSNIESAREAGLISAKEFGDLASKGGYLRTNVLDKLDPTITTYKFGKTPVKVSESGLQPLDKGTRALIEMDSYKLLEETVVRTETRIAKNEAVKDLAKVAKESPDNGILSLLGKNKKIPDGKTGIDYFIGGKKQTVLMDSKYAENWVVRDSPIASEFANTISWVSGAKITRATATGYNPLFAMTNFPRDLAHIYFTALDSSGKFVYKANPLKFIKDMGGDLAKTMSDAIHRRGSYLDYGKEGGLMSFLTNQGSTFKGAGRSFSADPVGGTMKVLDDLASYVGETSEIWTRLALRNGALRQGKPAREATAIARNYLDFSQGGTYAKALDNGIPYLNAGIQGTRGVVRAAMKNPKDFSARVGIIGGLSASLYMANRIYNPDTLANISETDKRNNWIITLPFSQIDDNGEERGAYIKIAKDQGQRIFSTMFENITAASMGDEVDYANVLETINDMLPVSPAGFLPPTMDALIGYSSNENFWRNKDIWTGPDVESYAEYHGYTNPAYVNIGKMFAQKDEEGNLTGGVSPERLKYTVSQLFIDGNPLSNIVGGGFRAMLDEVPGEAKRDMVSRLMSDVPGLRRVVGFSSPRAKRQKQINEENRKINTQNRMFSIKFKALAQKYDETGDKRLLTDFIKNLPKEKQRAYKTKFRDWKKIGKLPEKSYWTQLKQLQTPELRAKVFHTRLVEASAQERKQLESVVRKVPGLYTKRFRRTLRELKRNSGARAPMGFDFRLHSPEEGGFQNGF